MAWTEASSFITPSPTNANCRTIINGTSAASQRDAGESGIDLALLALADTRATYDHTLTQEHWAASLDVCRTLLEAWYEKADEVIKPPPLINGDDLINELKQKPGQELGKLLEAIRETQASGNITTREAALAFSRGWLAKARDVALCEKRKT